jgi:hypothetical protein
VLKRNGVIPNSSAEDFSKEKRISLRIVDIALIKLLFPLALAPYSTAPFSRLCLSVENIFLSLCSLIEVERRLKVVLSLNDKQLATENSISILRNFLKNNILYQK